MRMSIENGFMTMSYHFFQKFLSLTLFVPKLCKLQHFSEFWDGIWRRTDLLKLASKPLIYAHQNWQIEPSKLLKHPIDLLSNFILCIMQLLLYAFLMLLFTNSKGAKCPILAKEPISTYICQLCDILSWSCFAYRPYFAIKWKPKQMFIHDKILNIIVSKVMKVQLHYAMISLSRFIYTSIWHVFYWIVISCHNKDYRTKSLIIVQYLLYRGCWWIYSFWVEWHGYYICRFRDSKWSCKVKKVIKERIWRPDITWIGHVIIR